MRSRRPRTAMIFFAMGIVLLISIVVGQRVGDQVILFATERKLLLPELTITPAPEASDADQGRIRNWRRLDVVSVATDPAFPDPRVTPPPPPPPPRPAPTPSPRLEALPLPTVNDIYTSPPLPLPLVSHEPEGAPEPGPTLGVPSQ